MPQVVPLIGQASALADELHDAWDLATGDGNVCEVEVGEIGAIVDQLKVISTRADLAYQWGMAVLKGGIDGKRAKELELELSRFEAMQKNSAA